MLARKSGILAMRILRIIIFVGLVIWLLSFINLRDFLRVFQDMSSNELFLIVGLSQVGLALQYLRWKFLVSGNSTQFNKNDLIFSFFSGFAFRLIVPGGHGEVGKIFMLTGRKRGKMCAYGMDNPF